MTTTALGPYEQDSDARRDAKTLVAQYGVPAEQADWRWSKEALLAVTVHRAGVEFGGFDLATMELIAGVCSMEQCQAIVGWITRAAGGQLAPAVAARPEPMIERCETCHHTLYSCNATGCAGRQETGWRGWPTDTYAGHTFTVPAQRVPLDDAPTPVCGVNGCTLAPHGPEQLHEDAATRFTDPIPFRPPTQRPAWTPSALAAALAADIDLAPAPHVAGVVTSWPACEHRPAVREYFDPCATCQADQAIYERHVAGLMAAAGLVCGCLTEAECTHVTHTPLSARPADPPRTVEP